MFTFFRLVFSTSLNKCQTLKKQTIIVTFFTSILINKDVFYVLKCIKKKTVQAMPTLSYFFVLEGVTDIKLKIFIVYYR